MAVIVVGSVNADTTVTVDRLPQPGQTVHARSVGKRGGGKGANVAFAAASSSPEVVLVAQVGSDADADLALSGLEAAGVSLQRVRRSATATGTALVLVDVEGENCIVVDPGANFAWSGADLTAELEPASLVGGVVVTNFEVPASVCLAAGRAAVKAGATFVLNPSPLAPLSPELLACAPLIVVNALEAVDLAAGLGSRSLDLEVSARAISDATGGPVVVTLGADGAGVLDDRWTIVRGRRVQVVDTVGAGDAFLGAMAALLGRSGLLDAVGAAVDYAARVVQVEGARLG